MKKSISKYILIGMVTLGVASCDIGDFGDTNVNPNQTTQAIPSSLLTNSLTSLGGTVSATQGQLYSQYLANSQYTSADNYQTIIFDYGGYYSGILMDLEHIITMNTDEETKVEASLYGSNANQIAVAQILQSYYFSFITDRWGDIPYSQALNIGEGVRQPAFDPQSEVYAGILATLKTAQANISSTAPVQGDILFGGNMDMWKKFANTLRMKMALRMSEVDPTTAAAEFTSAVNDGVIALDNSENIYYQNLPEAAFQSPWFARFLTRRDYTVANTIVDRMQTTENGGVLDVAMDPRLPEYADPTDIGGMYVGMPYGLSEAKAGAISNSDVSFLNENLRAQDARDYIFTSAQVLFSMAEAAERGWISGDAEALYYQGIEASLDQYGVADGYDTYITNSWVQFDSSMAMEQILTQKWIALYLNGYEAWAEWRRTGYPHLDPAEDALNDSKEIPVRQAYPLFELNLNSDNYEAVVARQGADGLDTPVWWDVD
ncbi:SusD/RagB family nutrient-binding outer membrane lipoprotein [Algoriphagus halophytocola]|uniref:SusD/RagB family nutrient-binding outer membrane lipoprotein n=1 Tax=Algoriphagus halophytocola TaxID=2991499 RepID=A0ABY6MPS4_9BACT|nr:MULTISPECIES: SusD/RagB family nutrient-binding outer membrane lipoprotein [unclassified Algoriphagus]UZD24491.1 SusD/RagB family nutrient-binding outer membrane lipoprotein [Algoriphagus sp. TR-M5]WBL41855.1 SusD/RagB family nutrient-binding outer membrane lipoprotein [Algoriphagus sp. TR-M9]